MPSRSCGPYAVGKNSSEIIGDTMCILVSPPDAEMCSLSRARYVSIILVSRYCSRETAGHARRCMARDVESSV